MLCGDCDVKMKCVFSVPVNKKVRYRVYRCATCLQYEESMEVLANKVESSGLKALLEDGRRSRFFLLGKIRGGKL